MPQTIETTPGRWRRISKFAAIILKVAVTGACFWYLAKQVDFGEFARTVPTISIGWLLIAVLGAALQVPLIGLRWSAIIDALPGLRTPRPNVIAIAWISLFLGQVLPYAAGDAMRVLLLTRLGRDWRIGIVSVLVDRGIGVTMLFAYGFAVLVVPSELTELGGHRLIVVTFFGAVLVGVVLGLVVVPWIGPILVRWRYTRWIGIVALACYEVLAKSRSGIVVVALAIVVHTLTILCVWCVGRALGIAFSPFDAAVLFVLMLAVALIPISIGGWGLREVAVVALLASHGVPAEIALSLSITFGLVFVAGSLPGAIIWAVYSPARLTAVKVET